MNDSGLLSEIIENETLRSSVLTHEKFIRVLKFAALYPSVSKDQITKAVRLGYIEAIKFWQVLKDEGFLGEMDYKTRKSPVLQKTHQFIEEHKKSTL